MFQKHLAQAHSSVELASELNGLKMRVLDVDKNCALRGNTLEDAIKHDIEIGLIPFCVMKKIF